MTQLTTRSDMSPTFSAPSIIAILAAIGSFFVSPGLTIVLAVVAAIFGVIGFLISLSPAKRGGIISIVSIGIAVIALLVAVVRIIMYLTAGNNSPTL